VTVGRDERGAVMLIGVFFAIFAVSMLYLAIGTGETVLFREHLQDAADSAALSGAVTHARIMNVIVLINVVMSALLAVLVTIKLVEGAAIVGAVIAAGLAWVTGGATMAAIPPLNAIRADMNGLYEQVKSPIFNALEMLHDTADAVAEAAPKASDAVVQEDIEDAGGTLVRAGFAAPTAKTLPVEEDAYEELCQKAGEFPVEMGKEALGGLPGMGEVLGALKKPMGTMTRSLSSWFCGDGENSVPNLDQELDNAVQPRSDKTRACEGEQMATRDPSEEKNAQSALCNEAEAERAEAKPAADGRCQDGHYCSVGGPYDRAVTAARENCDPNGSPKPKAYRYQSQSGRVTYAWKNRAWVRGNPEVTVSWVNDPPTDTPPCGTLGAFRRVVYQYNRTVHPSSDSAVVIPACTNEKAPTYTPSKNAKDVKETVSFTQVTHILSCERKETVHVPVTDDKSPGSVEGNSKSPKRVLGDAKMGDEHFQVRAVMLGSTEQRESQRLIRLAQWGKPDPANPLESLRNLGGFAFAQAEYSYDGGEGRDEWMWNMNWRARLVRFSMPEATDGKNALKDVCAEHMDAGLCEKLLAVAADWNELLVH
jgi:hypothetical protein